MGNIGRSSTGCHLCRKRKIKCDEGKPGCRKCTLIKKECPGYPFSVELVVRSETKGSCPDTSIGSLLPFHPFAKPLALKEVSEEHYHVADCARRRLQSVDRIVPKCECPVPQSVLALVPQQRSIAPPPKYDIEHQSTSFFLHLFCYQASRLYGAPILDYLPEMLTQSRSESCIQKATKAVSRMTLADQYSGADVRLQTGREYVQALAVINATIRDQSQAIKDETVVAVWLLGLYEAVSSVLSHGRISGDNRTPEEEWQSHISHIRGALNLLHIRGVSQTNNPRAEKIYRVFKAAIQMRLFMLNSVTSTDFDRLDHDVYQDDFEFIPSKTAQRATVYFHTCANLLEELKHLLRRQREQLPSESCGEDLQDFFRRGEALDASMAGWSKTELGWDMMRVQESTAGTMWALYPSHAMYWFYNFWVFLYWLRYLMARIKLYEGLIAAVKQQKEILACKSCGHEPLSRLDFKISQYKTIFQLAAGELIGLTAYALGDVTNDGTFHSSISEDNPTKGFREINVVAAMQLVIPLKLLQRSEYPTLTQKGAINLALAQIGDGFRRTPIGR